MTVSNSAITIMGIATVSCLLIPIAAVIVFKCRIHGRLLPVFYGMLGFFIFALWLEPICHQFFLNPNNAVGQTILSHPLLYALYGGLAAGIFEETDRLAIFKYAMKSYPERKYAIACGIGHGGIEMLLLGALNLGATLLIALSLNMVGMEGYLEQAGAAGIDVATLETTLTSIASTPASLYALSFVERIAAFILQLSLSVFVFKAVREKKWLYYLLAIVLHMMIDVVAGLYQAGIMPLLLCEIIVAAYSVAVAVFAFREYKKMTGGVYAPAVSK